MTATDKLKLWSAALLVFGSVYVAGYELGSDQTAARLGVLVGGLLLALALVVFSASGRGFWGFVKAANVELRKVIWPSKEETIRMTGVVVALVAAVMLFLWLVDFIIGGLLDILAP